MSEYRTFFEGPNFFEKRVKHLIIIRFVKFQAVSRLPVLKQPMGTTISIYFFFVMKTPIKIQTYVRIPV